MLASSGRITARFLAETDFDMDYLAALFMHEVDQYRILSFENFGLSINIVPAAEAAPRFNLCGTFIGYEKYRIATYRESDSPKPMRIRFSATSAGNDEVQLHFLCNWHPVPEFLRHIKLIPDDSEPSTSSGRLNRQWNWWMKNGKRFRLLDLPVEMREIIYGFVFGPRIEPFPNSRARRRGKTNAPFAALQPAAALLSLSQQVRAEASNICFSHTTFYVEHLGILKRLTNHFKPCNSIRRLHLSLSHYGYLKLFNHIPSEDNNYGVGSCASDMRMMTLNVLEMQIAAPSPITESDALDGACQKIVVDWILKAALPYIGTHPVKLTGFVKSKQKAAFEAACRAARKQFDDWNQMRLAAGLELGTECEYGEWLEEYLADEDGGVSLVEREAVEHPLTNSSCRQSAGASSSARRTRGQRRTEC